MPVRRIISCALAIPLFLTALADPPADDAPVPLMQAQARVVQVDVVVTDNKGKAITDLSRKDFTLLDNGKVRTIDIFSLSDGGTVPVPPATPPALPRNVFSNRNSPPAIAPNRATVIVLDASPAKPAMQMRAFRAAQAQAIGRVMSMRSDEHIAVFVISKSEGLLLLQNYTSDRELLLRKLRGFVPRNLQPDRISPWIHDAPLPGEYTEAGLPLPTPADPPPSTGEPPPRRAMLVPAREQEYQIDNSVRENRMSLQTLAERLALLPGRKNIFWATTGFPPRLAHEPGWEHTLTALNEANVSLSSGGCSNSQREITAATGGTPTCLDTPSAAALNEGARSTYTLGFYLADTERDDTSHSIGVRVARPNVELFYRQGYFAGSTPKSLHERKPEMDSVLLDGVDATGIGITAQVDAKPGSPQGTVKLRLNLDPATLTLVETPGGWAGSVEEEFVEMNESGYTLAKISDRKHFDVTKSVRARYDREGVAWPFTMSLMPGTTQIAIVVRDSMTGRLGSLTIPLHE